MTASAVDQSLAILGGPKAVTLPVERLRAACKWPIITAEDEQAVLAVMRDGTFSGISITQEFEKEFAAWQGVPYALASANGTMALQQAMWAVGLGSGDEMICPSITYWASALQVFALRGTVVFADIDPRTLCLDPRDIEHRIGPRTKAIMVVHYCGHPCDMDAIMAIARKHRLKVIEDVSHAQGSLYKGRMVGTFGDVAAMSLMGGKSFAVGEGGMLLTANREVYERAVAFGAYERTKSDLTLDYLVRAAGLPLGGVKGRLNQTCSAMGRVQLRHYPARIVEIQRAMNRFWDLLEGTPGVAPHRPDPQHYPDSTMGGWYNPLGLYDPAALGGLPVERFLEAVKAEGAPLGRGVNMPLHLHPLLNETDVYREGKPTRLAHASRDVRQPRGSLPVSEHIAERAYGIIWFKKDDVDLIEQCAAAVRKVCAQAKQLLAAPPAA